MEQIACLNIMEYVETRGILTDRQLAFLKKRSCETHLCATIDEWGQHLDNGQQTDMFILDFEKAFDTVPQKLLMFKLKKSGISKSLIKWIDAFLCHRQQNVVINCSSS